MHIVATRGSLSLLAPVRADPAHIRVVIMDQFGTVGSAHLGTGIVDGPLPAFTRCGIALGPEWVAQSDTATTPHLCVACARAQQGVRQHGSSPVAAIRRAIIRTRPRLT